MIGQNKLMKLLAAYVALLLAACEHVPPTSVVSENVAPRVLIRVLVKADGTVGDLEVVESSGSPRTDKMAIDAARKTKFRPFIKDGVPQDVWASVPVNVEVPYAPEMPRAEESLAVQARRNMATRALMQAYVATLKADFSAMSTHCSALDKNYIPRFAERRAHIEPEWLESIRALQLLSFLATKPKKHPLERDPVMEPLVTAENMKSLPDLSAENQEKIKQNSNEKLKVAMSSLTLDRQRERCDAALLPQAVKQPIAEK
jgi:TonB family protein